MSAEQALLNHHKRQLGLNKRTKKNKHPEKDVVKSCMIWFAENGFSMSVVESKATFSEKSGRYISGQAEPGFPDSAGCTPYGYGCFVEFKAKGRLSTLRDEQRDFLTDKIHHGSFACVVDCVDRLYEIYTKWLNKRNMGDHVSKEFLLSCLPDKKKKVSQDNLFDEIV